MDLTYSKEELHALPEKLYEEFLEKKRRRIIFEVFKAAANGQYSLHFKNFFSQEGCDIEYVDSIHHLVHGKIHFTIVRLCELIRENFPDSLVHLVPVKEDYTDYEDTELRIEW